MFETKPKLNSVIVVSFLLHFLCYGLRSFWVLPFSSSALNDFDSIILFSIPIYLKIKFTSEQRRQPSKLTICSQIFAQSIKWPPFLMDLQKDYQLDRLLSLIKMQISADCTLSTQFISNWHSSMVFVFLSQIDIRSVCVELSSPLFAWLSCSFQFSS